MTRTVLAAAAAVALLAPSAGAHHSFSAEYDGSKPVKVSGVVKRVEWANPHIWFYVEGKDDVTGRMAVWGFSGAPPALLARRGIRRDVLKIGDTVLVEGFLAILTAPDGKEYRYHGTGQGSFVAASFEPGARISDPLPARP